MAKMRLVGLTLGAVLLLFQGLALAGGVDAAFYEGTGVAVGLFGNSAGTAVTGMQIEFDKSVTIVNKIEFGGFLPAVTELTGTSFVFAGGSLVDGGMVELDWQPADAKPTFIIWLSGGSPVGAPFFTTIDKLGYLLGQGIVALREANPAALQAAMEQLFADNEEFFAGLEATLGMSLADSLMPIILTAPAEGIENFFNTLVGMLGVTDLGSLMQSDVDLSALLGLLGL